MFSGKSFTLKLVNLATITKTLLQVLWSERLVLDAVKVVSHDHEVAAHLAFGFTPDDLFPDAASQLL